MNATARVEPVNALGSALLEQFERHLPPFGDLDSRSYLKFLKAIHLLTTCYEVSHQELEKRGLERYLPILERLNVLLSEYMDRDRILASAIMVVKIHIESYYAEDQDARLVHNLTSLHIYYSDKDGEHYIMSSPPGEMTKGDVHDESKGLAPEAATNGAKGGRPNSTAPFTSSRSSRFRPFARLALSAGL
jgi:hypothetical protein